MTHTLAKTRTESKPLGRLAGACKRFTHVLEASLKTGLLVVLLTLLTVSWQGFWQTPSATAAPLIANLPPGNAITDGKALLRYALPIDNKEIRTIQKNIEETSEALRSRKRLGTINSNLIKVERILDSRPEKLLDSVPGDRRPQAEALIDQLKASIADMRLAVEAQDKEALWSERGKLLDQVGQLEELMVSEFPFEVPEEFSNLPQLRGRATVAVETTKGDMNLVVDGYSAPVTAGNFVDLVQRGFYDGLEFTRAEEFYVAQIGDPPGPEDGFIDPQTKEYRNVPLEILVDGDTEPTYGVTLESVGRYLDQPVLPFSAFGTLGMARPGDDANGGSSQFFFFLFEPELTPAGLNLLDGRYAAFGYVTENKEVLEKIRVGDKILSARVVEGAENLVQPS